MTIKFGTDGWRAQLDKDFTLENVAKIVQAFSDLYPSANAVMVGFDRRRLAKEAADMVARVLLANNITPILSQGVCTTPCVSWMTVKHKATAGIMITASHNPPNWNGLKFKEAYGGAASPLFTDPVEQQITANDTKGKKPNIAPEAALEKVQRFDPHGEYITQLKKFVDYSVIKKSVFRVMADPMYGAGAEFWKDLLGDQVTQIHEVHDFNFGGLHPEPIQPYVNELMETMKNGDYSAGLITDGDADRIGAVDENGNFVTSHEIFSLLLQHVAEYKKWTGKVIKSISTTQMIDRLCRKYNFPLDVSPIGFKHISPAMKEEGVLIAGEESGGIGLPKHVCERDGLLCGLLILEMMAVRGKTLGELVRDLQKNFGPCLYQRIDLKLPAEEIAKAKENLKKAEPKTLAGLKIKKITTIDGKHFLLEDDSWLLMRSSGTEPLFRTYAEAPNLSQVRALLQEAKTIVA